MVDPKLLSGNDWSVAAELKILRPPTCDKGSALAAAPVASVSKPIMVALRMTWQSEGKEGFMEDDLRAVLEQHRRDLLATIAGTERQTRTADDRESDPTDRGRSGGKSRVSFCP